MILDPPDGEGIAYDGTAEGPRPAETQFALCLGPQWLDQWKGANACVLVPSVGAVGQGATGSAIKTLQGKRDRIALFSLMWGVEIHVWGREPDALVVGRQRDVERYREAFQIFENVSRVLYLYASGYGLWSDNQGWNTETPINRYGEAILATIMFPVPVYDYPRFRIPRPTDQQLIPDVGQPIIQNPGGSP
jgi:hypothetical protein